MVPPHFGKLQKIGGRKSIYFEDLLVRQSAQENPGLFFDQFKNIPLMLDEASLAPEIFSELKRRVDEQRRDPSLLKIDVWITGSNQTLLQKNVRESLAGRANYFDLNTLSLHELKKCDLSEVLLKGGWPELYLEHELDHVRYLNDLILTFIEKDIVYAAGIERREAFSKSLHLIAGRLGQLVNSSDIAKNVGVDTTTIQSWISLLEQNGLLLKLQAYSSNINQGLPLKIYYVRSKEKVEIDLLIELPDNKFIAAEVKVTPKAWDDKQHQLIDSLGLNVIEKWILTPTRNSSLPHSKIVEFQNI